MIFAPICGYLGDRFNRKIIMSVGLSIWTLAVLFSSFASRGVRFLLLSCVFLYEFIGILLVSILPRCCRHRRGVIFHGGAYYDCRYVFGLTEELDANDFLHSNTRWKVRLF